MRKYVPKAALARPAKIKSRKIKSAPGPFGKTTVRPPSLREILRIETVPIVDNPFLRITQYVVGFLDFLETLFSALVAGIDIWMVLPCETTISLFYVGLFGRARNTQNPIIVLLSHESLMLAFKPAAQAFRNCQIGHIDGTGPQTPPLAGLNSEQKRPGLSRSPRTTSQRAKGRNITSCRPHRRTQRRSLLLPSPRPAWRETHRRQIRYEELVQRSSGTSTQQAGATRA